MARDIFQPRSSTAPNQIQSSGAQRLSRTEVHHLTQGTAGPYNLDYFCPQETRSPGVKLPRITVEACKGRTSAASHNPRQRRDEPTTPLQPTEPTLESLSRFTPRVFQALLLNKITTRQITPVLYRVPSPFVAMAHESATWMASPLPGSKGSPWRCP